MTPTSKLVILSRILLLTRQAGVQEEIVKFHEGKVLHAMEEQKLIHEQIETLQAELAAMEVSYEPIAK